jgi:hypothetical protein
MKAQGRHCIARQLLAQPSRSSRGDIYSPADPTECSLQDSAPTLPIMDVCHKEFRNVRSCCASDPGERRQLLRHHDRRRNRLGRQRYRVPVQPNGRRINDPHVLGIGSGRPAGLRWGDPRQRRSSPWSRLRKSNPLGESPAAAADLLAGDRLLHYDRPHHARMNGAQVMIRARLVELV